MLFCNTFNVKLHQLLNISMHEYAPTIFNILSRFVLIHFTDFISLATVSNGDLCWLDSTRAVNRSFPNGNRQFTAQIATCAFNVGLKSIVREQNVCLCVFTRCFFSFSIRIPELCQQKRVGKIGGSKYSNFLLFYTWNMPTTNSFQEGNLPKMTF